MRRPRRGIRVTERTILHCDLDAFYASVEQRDHPEYRGKPVIVGGGPTERGVVSAASYEARKFGVHSAMPLRQAGKLCPHGIFVPAISRHTRSRSDAVMALFAERTPLVEPISLDEAFLDVTGTAHLFGGPEACARDLKRAVREQVGLVLSVAWPPTSSARRSRRIFASPMVRDRVARRRGRLPRAAAARSAVGCRPEDA